MSYEALWQALEAAVHHGPGDLPPGERQRAWQADHAPDFARAAPIVRRRGYKLR